MLRKWILVCTVIGVAVVLAACGGGQPATAPVQPATGESTRPIALPTEAATPLATQPATDVAPGGGTGAGEGGGTPAETISPDNVDRLGPLFEFPLTDPVLGMSFSPNGTLLAVATPTGGVLFDVNQQIQLGRFADGVALSGVVWSPDGLLVVGIPGDPSSGKIVIWDWMAHTEAGYLKDQLAGKTAFAWSPDGATAVTGGKDGVVTLWTVPDANKGASFNVTDAGADASAGQQPFVVGVSYLGDGKTLVISTVGVYSETLRWDTAANSALPKLTPEKHIAGPIATALFAPGDAAHVYWWSRGSVIMVDIATDSETARLQTEDFIQSVAFSADGKLLAAGTAGAVDGTLAPIIKLWNTVSGQDARVISGLAQIPSAMAFSPDGTLMAFATGNGIAIWGLVQNK